MRYIKDKLSLLLVKWGQMTDKVKKKAPGRFERKGITVMELAEMFPNDKADEEWFVKRRWPNRIACVECGSVNVQTGAKHKTMSFRCREKDCSKKFSVKSGTAMEGSKIGCKAWVYAIYLVTTNLKGVSSMKLARDIGVTQKTAWFLAQRIRESWSGGHPVFSSPIEADETYVGGLEKNKHKDKRMKAAGGPVGKAIVAGLRERETGRVVAKVVPDTSAHTLTRLVAHHVDPFATVFADEARGYLPLNRMGYDHQSVSHSAGQYVDEMAHTNGMESFWATMNRGYHGVYHQMSHEHLHRYVNEFSGRHNQRPLDTEEQMEEIVKGMNGKRLTYEQLIASGPHAKKRAEEIVVA